MLTTKSSLSLCIFSTDIGKLTMTSRALHWALTVLLFLIAGIAHAQTACPPGMTPYGVGVCGYDNSQQHPAQQQPPPPPLQWATRRGAIATDFAHESTGASVDKSSKSDAEKAALAECISNGGSTCKIQITYDNECAAMVVGDKVFDVTADTTVDKAVRAGMNSCNAANDHTCRIYYSACSLPVRIQ